MKNTNKNYQNIHIPVLLDEVLGILSPKEGETYLDLTAGYGGHSAAVLERTLNPQGSVLVDRDTNAIDSLKELFAGSAVQIVQKDFLGASKQMISEGRRFDMILADLGVSSPHLDNASRGFSFSGGGPLDMRMDQTQSLTAAEIVNSYPEDRLADIFHEYGEEPKAKKIARLISEDRPFSTTSQLAETVARAWPGYSKIHPATRVFQALRIAVNSELEQIKQALPIWMDLLSPGGRMAVISFHSLEDRIVKQFFAENAGERYDTQLRSLTRQPLTAGEHELVSNPRARSAKLRAAVKIKIK